MNMVDVRIMAHPKRRDHVLAMLAHLNLGEDMVSYDDRPYGGSALYTAKLAWLTPVPEGMTHRVVLQDDLALCHDFVAILNRMVRVYPESIFSLLSGAYPKHRLPNSPYIDIWNARIEGQAILMPVPRIGPCFEWIAKHTNTPWDDAAITEYARAHKINVKSTIPSTVQHLTEMPSLFEHRNWGSRVWQGPDLSAEKWD